MGMSAFFSIVLPYSLVLAFTTGAPPTSLILPFQPHLHHGQVNNGHKSVNQDGGQQTDTDKARELWLEDFSKDYLNEMQSDGVGGETGGKVNPLQCPPPYSVLPRDACEAPPCQSDKECPHGNCCYNGCIFTCMVPIPRPPVIDWRLEPPRKEWGKAWLLPASNDSKTNYAEICSTPTASADDSGLLCPHGYICHIEYMGNTRKGIPNRGRCIPTMHKPSTSQKLFQMKLRGSSHSQCVVPGNGVYTHGTKFRYHRHLCQCQEGMVMCKVGRA